MHTNAGERKDLLSCFDAATHFHITSLAVTQSLCLAQLLHAHVQLAYYKGCVNVCKQKMLAQECCSYEILSASAG